MEEKVSDDDQDPSERKVEEERLTDEDFMAWTPNLQGSM
jgi:hypothetical protein